MKKNNLNFAIDALAFVAFVFLTATGVLIRYVLPPGSGHFSTLWGMDRHDWGQIHFWIAFVLLATLGFHLFLHWRWVVSMVKGRPHEGSGLRIALAIVGMMALAFLAAAPFFGRVEQTGEPPHRMRLIEPDGATLQKIDGSMTLDEVEQLTGVLAKVIVSELGLPPELPGGARLGRLRKEYGFELDDVRKVVRRHLKQ